MDSTHRKYPRTFHLPYSPGASKEDKIQHDVSNLIGRNLIMTEKMDGSNVCLTRDAVFARSHNGPPSHPSFDLLKAQHAAVKRNIPEHVEVFGEWLYAVHSIRYNNLPSYLQVFGVRSGTVWWAWEETQEMANEILVSTTPAIFEFYPETEAKLRSKVEIVTVHNFFKPACGDSREGVVVRPLGEFRDEDFDRSVIKWVRANHVQTDEHWKHKAIETNELVTNGS